MMEQEAVVPAGSDEVRAEIRTAATPEAVWAAWTDPRELARWFMDEARGAARPGEVMTWIWRDFGVEAPYEVRAADPPGRLVLETGAQVAPPGLIRITIARSGGETVVTIVNSGFLDAGVAEPVVEGIRSGWTMALALMKEYVERHSGGDRTPFLHLRPTTAPLDRMLRWFAEEPLLTRWLTRAGAPAAPGGTVRLTLRDGSTLSARTIARTAYELAFVVDGNTAIELKAFAMGPGRNMVGVRGTSWSTQPAEIGRLRTAFSGGIDRLVGELED